MSEWNKLLIATKPPLYLQLYRRKWRDSKSMNDVPENARTSTSSSGTHWQAEVRRAAHLEGGCRSISRVRTEGLR